jgi:hypothetical protein
VALFLVACEVPEALDLRFARVNYSDPRFVVLAAVTRDHCQIMLDGGGRNDEVWLREGVSGFPAFFDQQSPFEHDVFGDRKNPVLKHRPYFVGQPVL